MSSPKRKLILLESVRQGQSQESFKRQVAEKLRQQGLLQPDRATPSRTEPSGRPPLTPPKPTPPTSPADPPF